MIDPFILAHSLEGVSRAHAAQFRRFRDPDDRTAAIAALDHAVRIMDESSLSEDSVFAEFEIRIPRAQLEFANSGVLELRLIERHDLAAKVKSQAAAMGDDRIVGEMASQISEIEATMERGLRRRPRKAS